MGFGAVLEGFGAPSVSIGRFWWFSIGCRRFPAGSGGQANGRAGEPPPPDLSGQTGTQTRFWATLLPQRALRVSVEGASLGGAVDIVSHGATKHVSHTMGTSLF